MTTLKAAATLGNNSPSRILLTSKIFLEVAAEVCHIITTHNLLSIFLKTWFRFSKTINFETKPDWGNAAEEIFLREVQAVNDLFVFLRMKIVNQLKGNMENMISLKNNKNLFCTVVHSWDCLFEPGKTEWWSDQPSSINFDKHQITSITSWSSSSRPPSCQVFRKCSILYSASQRGKIL